MLEAQMEKTRTMVELGRVTEADLLQIRSRHYAALNDVAAAEGQCSLSRMELCQLLEIIDYEGFAIEPVPVDTCGGQMLFMLPDSLQVEARPEYRSAEIGGRSQNATSRLQGHHTIPAYHCRRDTAQATRRQGRRRSRIRTALSSMRHTRSSGSISTTAAHTCH